jgi:hypothetical protein
MHFLFLLHAELQIAIERCGRYRTPLRHLGALLLRLADKLRDDSIADFALDQNTLILS